MRTLTRSLFALACLAGAASAALAENAPLDLSGRIDALFAASAGRKLPGAVVLVLRDGAVVHSKAYGLASVEGGLPNTTRTKFRLASVSKSFTALLVLQLAEQGRLRLDDPLERYVPGVVGGDAITIHHLLSHTAGMPDFMSFEDAARLPRDAAPGERLNYSNLGYSALGRVIEKVTGKTGPARVPPDAAALSRAPHAFASSAAEARIFRIAAATSSMSWRGPRSMVWVSQTASSQRRSLAGQRLRSSQPARTSGGQTRR